MKHAARHPPLPSSAYGTYIVRKMARSYSAFRLLQKSVAKVAETGDQTETSETGYHNGLPTWHLAMSTMSHAVPTFYQAGPWSIPATLPLPVARTRSFHLQTLGFGCRRNFEAELESAQNKLEKTTPKAREQNKNSKHLFKTLRRLNTRRS